MQLITDIFGIENVAKKQWKINKNCGGKEVEIGMKNISICSRKVFENCRVINVISTFFCHQYMQHFNVLLVGHLLIVNSTFTPL